MLKPYFSVEIWSYLVLSPTARLNNAEHYVFITTLTLNVEWINSCTEEAFVLWLHLCVACSCALTRAKQHFSSLCLCTFICSWYSRLCVSLYLCVCLSDPCVAPHSASSFTAPYQKRKRTLTTRMYHSRQFSSQFCFAKNKKKQQRYQNVWIFVFSINKRVGGTMSGEN